MKQNYFVFTQKLAAELMRSGFCLQGVEKSESNPGRNVFVFRDSAELRYKIHQINARRKSNEKERV